MPKLPFGNLGNQLSNRNSVSFRNIRGGVVSAQELVVAGGTNGVVRSQNYDPTTELGWAVFGDGSAFFYGDVTIGEDAVVLGDVLGSWDGANPVDLSSIDTTATTGFALDSSVGTGQFMNSLFAAGIGFMDVLNNNTQVGAIGGSNDELLINGVGSKTVRIQTLTGGTIEMDPGSGGATVLNSDTEIAGDLFLSSGGKLTTNQSPSNGDVWIEYRGNDTGAIIGQRRSGGIDLITAQLEVTADGLEMAAGEFHIRGTAAGSIIDSPLGQDLVLSVAGTPRWAVEGNRWVALTGTAVMENINEIWVSDGSAGDPSYTFQDDQDAGFFHAGGTGGNANIGFSAGGVHGGSLRKDGIRLVQGNFSSPAYSFMDDIDTGMYLNGAGELWFTVGGSVSFGLFANRFNAENVSNDTTGAGANVFVSSSFPGRMQRSTSSLRYKPGWVFMDEDWLADLTLPQPITWQDEQGGLMLGFGTEHVLEMLPAAVQDYGDEGEPENYDVRSLVAILSAKVKRLEREVAALS